MTRRHNFEAKLEALRKEHKNDSDLSHYSISHDDWYSLLLDPAGGTCDCDPEVTFGIPKEGSLFSELRLNEKPSEPPDEHSQDKDSSV